MVDDARGHESFLEQVRSSRVSRTRLSFEGLPAERSYMLSAAFHIKTAIRYRSYVVATTLGLFLASAVLIGYDQFVYSGSKLLDGTSALSSS